MLILNIYEPNTGLQIYTAIMSITNKRKWQLQYHNEKFQCIFSKGSNIQKLSKDKDYLNNTINKLFLMAICKILHLTTREYTFFSCLLRAFVELYHVPALRKQTSTNFREWSEIVYDSHATKLEVTNKQLNSLI